MFCDFQTVKRAVRSRSRAQDECFLKRILAEGSGKHEGIRIDGDELDAPRRLKRHVSLITQRIQLVGLQHELRPYRQSRARPFKVEVAIIIEPHPRDHKQILCVPGKPAIARSSSLSGGRQLESPRANPRACPMIYHAFHQVRHRIPLN